MYLGGFSVEGLKSSKYTIFYLLTVSSNQNLPQINPCFKILFELARIISMLSLVFEHFKHILSMKGTCYENVIWHQGREIKLFLISLVNCKFYQGFKTDTQIDCEYFGTFTVSHEWGES